MPALYQATNTHTGGAIVARGIDLVKQGQALMRRGYTKAVEDSAGGNAGIEGNDSAFGCPTGQGGTFKTNLNAALSAIDGVNNYLATLDLGRS